MSLRALGANPFESLGSDTTDGYGGRIIDPETGEDVFTPNTDPTVVGVDDDGTAYPVGTDVGFAAPLRRFLQLGVSNGDFGRGPRDSSLPLQADAGSGYNPLPYWQFTPDPTGAIVVTWVADAASASGGKLRWTVTAAESGAEAYVTQLLPATSSRGQTFLDVPIAFWKGTAAAANLRLWVEGQYLATDGVTLAGSSGETSAAFFVGETNAQLSTINAGRIPSNAAWLRLRCGVRATGAGTGAVDLHEVGRLVGVPATYLVDRTLPNSYVPGRLDQTGGSVTLEADGGAGSALVLQANGNAFVSMWDEGDTFSVIDGALRVTEILAPAAPASGVKVYSKADNGLWAQNDAGAAVDLFKGGSGRRFAFFAS